MKIPRITSEYTHIYAPSADIFPCDSAYFTAGTTYENWVPNDFTVVQSADNAWHMIGITHPAPSDFVSHSDYNPASIHDGEWLLFHAVSKSKSANLTDVITPHSFTDAAKLLPPSDREGEEKNIYAPHIICREGEYRMFYGPGPIRSAVSTDLYNWTTLGAQFHGHGSDRDPHILPYKDGYRMTYVSENRLLGRFSRDLATWSEPDIVMTMIRPGVPESPFIVPHDGAYYLFWCIYDGTNGPYDNRTFVSVSDTPERFDGANCIAELPAHAPEIVLTADGKGYIFSAEYPNRGISAAKIEWI